MKSAHDSDGWKAVWRRELVWMLEDTEHHHVSPFTVAWVYSRVGDREGAPGWLNKPVEERDGPLVYLVVDQRRDFVRSDPTPG